MGGSLGGLVSKQRQMSALERRGRRQQGEDQEEDQEVVGLASWLFSCIGSLLLKHVELFLKLIDQSQPEWGGT